MILLPGARQDLDEVAAAALAEAALGFVQSGLSLADWSLLSAPERVAVLEARRVFLLEEKMKLAALLVAAIQGDASAVEQLVGGIPPALLLQQAVDKAATRQSTADFAREAR